MISTGSGILRRTLQSCNASLQKTHIQRLSTKANVPPRKKVFKEERTAQRQARREQAVQSMEGSANTSSKAAPAVPAKKPIDSRIAFGLGVGVPTALLAWGIADEESPPAQFAKMIGLTGLIEGYGDTFARPSRDKLLPDWPMPNVPADMPAPHTLVLDLENTLVNATWDRKHGWRFAKRPGVGKFLTDMAQYYEIVIYSPSIDGVADEVVNKLDKDGAVMHRLYRDACYYKKGVYMKDLDKLNRNTNRIVYIDDDYESAKLNPNNHIKIKPYDDPTDREDNSLERITPFLIEIAKEGYSNVPLLLKPYNDDGMDSDDIASEHERRVAELREMRMNSSKRGLGAFSAMGARNMPAPEMTPVKNRNAKRTAGPTAKDLVGSAPPGAETTATGVAGWMQRRQVEQAEENQRKMEYWNEVMLKKQQEKAAASQN